MLITAVSKFSDAMYDKLVKKKLQGYRGWNDPKWNKDKRRWQARFEGHVRKAKRNGYTPEDMVDIANFCMMRWWNEKESEQ